MRARGFTLVELVVVIVLMGIVAGVSALLVGKVMTGYADLESAHRVADGRPTGRGAHHARGAPRAAQ